MSDWYAKEEAKRLALQLRKKLGLESVRRLNMFVVLEKMAEAFRDFKYERVDDGQMRSGEGFYDSESLTIRFPARVFDALDRDPRARFTVAHEIGHWVRAHDGPRFRNAQRKAYEQVKPNIRRDEREADEFAVQFLAPDHLVENCRTVSEIQRDFGLSLQAAEIRKEEVEAWVRRRTGQNRALPTNVINFLERARAKGHTITSLPVTPAAAAVRQATVRRAPTPPAPKHYIDERCTNCGEQTLVPIDNKFHCDTCKHVSDGFQDGDIVA